MSDAEKPESLGFDFAPEWARKSADEYVSRYQGKNYDERTGREERPRREGGFRDRPPRRDGERPRPPRREGEGFRGPRPDGPRRPRREGAEGERPRGPRREGGRPFERRVPVKPLDADIRILPNQKTLGSIIKTLQGTHVAFPVKKFVSMFLDNPQACLVRFEAKPETETRFWSCKACGLVALSEAELVQHLLSAHLNDFFDVAEEPCDPPSGNFPRVAKCTLTGEWVGAPNHHSYRHRVAELAAKAGMDERDYLRTLEMHTDAESIEAWKQSITTQTVYRLKVAPVAETPAAETPAAPEAPEGEAAPAPEAPAETRPAYSRDQAEAIFRRDILPGQVVAAKHVCLPVSLAQTSPSLPLRLLLKYTLRDEQRYPRSLFFALRGAFRHRKFTLFRGNDARGPEFVANMVPTPFTAEHAVREIKAALDHVAAHSLCTRGELLAALKAELPDMDIGLVARQIAFLFQKGHIVEYYNGVLALPEENPKFRKLPEEMKREREAAGVEPAPAEASAAEASPEAPAAETLASEAEVEAGIAHEPTAESTRPTPAEQPSEAAPGTTEPEACACACAAPATEPTPASEPEACACACDASATEPEACVAPVPEPAAPAPATEPAPAPEGAPHDAE